MAAVKQTSHWLILILLALAQFMAVLDASIVNVALPSIQSSFHMTQASLQWIVTAYALAFGGFLLFGGRAADLFGRRKVFLSGVTIFALASLAAGVATSGTMLVVFRALQGLAAAFMSPAALSIVLVTYREGHERNIALSVWGAVAAGGAAVGVLLGGILTEYAGWRWNFFVNVPVAIGVLIAAMRILPLHESEAEHRKLDLTGAALITGGLMLLVYTLVHATETGWFLAPELVSNVTAMFVTALLLIVGFVINESRVKNPLMPLSIFRIRNVAGANGLQLMMASSLFSVFFFASLYMQQILHYSPVRTGLSFLIVPVIIALSATNVPRIIKRFGFRPILIVAPLFVGSGLLILSQLPVDGSYWQHIFPGLALMALGAGATFVSVSIAATSGVKPQMSGLASGLVNTAQQLGGSLGLAVLSAVAASGTTGYIRALGTQPDAQQLIAARVHGFHNGYLVAACFTLAASIVATLVIRNQTNVTVDPEALIGG
ncbi:MAG: MFS transporter [Candidatus Saccharimonadales bacterium]